MLGLVFLSGAVAGALGMRSGFIPPCMLMPTRRSLTTFCHKELNLDPQQANQLRSILDDMGKYNEDLQAQLESVRTQIEDVRATGKSRSSRS